MVNKTGLYDTMIQSTANLISTHETHDRLIAEIAQRIPSSGWHRLVGAANPPVWIVGHLAACRRETLRIIGGSCPHESWEPLFHDGHPPTPPSICGTSLAQDCAATGCLLVARMRMLSQMDLNAAFADGWWIGPQTTEGFLQFRCWHETYHVGQLAFVERALMTING